MRSQKGNSHHHETKGKKKTLVRSDANSYQDSESDRIHYMRDAQRKVTTPGYDGMGVTQR